MLHKHKRRLMQPAEKSSYPKFGKRHLVALWLFSGIVNVYILRVSINVAIVSMVNETSVTSNTSYNLLNDTDTCPISKENNTTVSTKQGDFNWDHATQGVILSSFYYGYICTQFIGGFLVRVIGTRLLFGIGVGGTAALTLLNPIAARTDPAFLIGLRVLEGFLEGVTFPCSHNLLGNWAPKKERSLLVAFPLSGTNIGTIIAAPLTGLLCEYGFDGGWASSFYVFGAASLLWCVGWFYCIHDTPAEHPKISPGERKYIEENCQSTARSVPFTAVPWKSIILSPPVWAVIIGHTCFNWNFYTLLTEVSTYLKDVLHISASLNGIVTSIPFICVWLLQVIGALFSDFLRTKGWKTRTVRKFTYCTGMSLSAVFLVTIAYAGCDVTIVMILLCLSAGFSGFGYCGWVVNHVDIAPQYAGILMGITNTFATLPGILSPLLAGALTNQHSTIATWQIIFYISAGVSLFGAILFGIFADGKVQRWARVDDTNGLVHHDKDEDSISNHDQNYGTDEAIAIEGDGKDTDVVIRQR